MTYIEYLAANWPSIIAILCMIVVVCMSIYKFLEKPTKEQLANVKEWLLWAVSLAEKELGGGTGELKLVQVYDHFTERFPVISACVSFKTFSGWVDEALVEMKRLLAENKDIKEVIEGAELQC